MLNTILKCIPFICVIILLVMFVRLAKKAAAKDTEIHRLTQKAVDLHTSLLMLRDAVGPEAVNWSHHDNLGIDLITRIPPNKTIVISAIDLRYIYDARYKLGAAETKAENIPYPICNDKCYDGLYRDHVNKLTAIAKEFYGAGQLRARIADVVINFRHELAAMQLGNMKIPGKKNPPINKFDLGSKNSGTEVVHRLNRNVIPLPEKPKPRSSPEKF